MKRVRITRRWLYRIMVIASFLIAWIVAIGWELSFTRSIQIGIPLAPNMAIEFSSAPGSVQLSYVNNPNIGFVMSAESYDEINRRLGEFGARLNPPETNWLRFRRFNNGVHGIWSVEFPFWFAQLITVVLLFVLLLFHHRSSPKRGRCAACNYDLRGSTQSTSCPECGQAIPRPATQDAGIRFSG